MEVPKNDASARPNKMGWPGSLETSEAFETMTAVPRQRPPPSTNISSPVRAPLKRQKSKSGMASILDAEDEEIDHVPPGDLHRNGYEKDDFVVSDEEDDAFEPVPASRRAPVQRKAQRQQTLHELGSQRPKEARPTTENLNEIHQHLIEAFVEEARKLEEQLRNHRRLRKTIFTDEQLRWMIVKWTTNISSMRAIPGVDVEKVDTFGSKFIPVVKRFHDQYLEMMDGDVRQQVPTACPTNVSNVGYQDVVDLISSDEEDGGGVGGGQYGMGNYEDDEEDDEDCAEEEFEKSRFFADRSGGSNTRGFPDITPQRQAEIDDFNRQFEEAGKQSDKASTAASTKSSTTSWKGKRPYNRKSGGSRGGGRSYGGSRAGSSTGGVSKRRSYGSRKSGGGSGSTFASGSGATKGRGGASSSKAKKTTASAGGISMMPL